MIGANTLTQIVDELKIYEPDKILNELDRKVRQLLKQDGDKQAINDGMDVALCVIQQTDTHTHLAFAGAKRPLLLFQNGEMTEYKGDKSPIGSSFYETKSFTAHHCTLQQGDHLYIFSDGITDQFDASNTKKFTYKRLKELLQKLQNVPFDTKKEQIANTFFDWKGKTAQTDDVLLMGIAV
jgi:serine phosphatase RsbU (regulator of sigma subunit)